MQKDLLNSCLLHKGYNLRNNAPTAWTPPTVDAGKQALEECPAPAAEAWLPLDRKGCPDASIRAVMFSVFS